MHILQSMWLLVIQEGTYSPQSHSRSFLLTLSSQVAWVHSSQCLILTKMWQRLFGSNDFQSKVVTRRSAASSHQNPSHLHRAALLVRTPLDGWLEAVSNSLTRGPVCRSQMVHEALQTHHTVVLLQWLQLEIFTVRNMHLLQGEKKKAKTEYSAKRCFSTGRF